MATFANRMNDTKSVVKLMDAFKDFIQETDNSHRPNNYIPVRRAMSNLNDKDKKDFMEGLAKRTHNENLLEKELQDPETIDYAARVLKDFGSNSEATADVEKDLEAYKTFHTPNAGIWSKMKAASRIFTTKNRGLYEILFNGPKNKVGGKKRSKTRRKTKHKRKSKHKRRKHRRHSRKK